MEQAITFTSDGLTLSGIVHTPDDLKPGETRPAICVLHGFGSNKESTSCLWPARTFADWGYITLRFDMRSCGDSDGEKNHINCLEQVEDTKAAITYMQGRDDVDSDRIGLIGSSFGAAVTVYTAGVDDRVAAAISSGGWGDGERKFRNQHVGDEAFLSTLGLQGLAKDIESWRHRQVDLGFGRRSFSGQVRARDVEGEEVAAVLRANDEDEPDRVGADGG